MTDHTNPLGSLPTGESPNWSWLQERLANSATAELDAWLTQQLDELETQFRSFITPKSLSRFEKQELLQRRNRH